jgi:hypothetical protein
MPKAMRQRVVMESKSSEGGQLLVHFGFGRSALGGYPPKESEEDKRQQQPILV